MDKGDAKNGAPSAPNASMDLLARIVEGSLDPSYRKHHEQAGPKEKWWLRTGIFLASIALAFATIIAVSDMVSTKDEVPEAMERLTSQIEQKQIAVDELEVLTAQLEDRLAQAESHLSGSVLRDPSLEVAAASRRLEGPGIVVTVSGSIGGSGQPSVRDTHLRSIINSLWAGGAEAIAVNGQRMGPQTNVRIAGSVVLVNLRAITSPYVIEAIGDPEVLKENLYDGMKASGVDQQPGIAISVASFDRLVVGPLPFSKLFHVEAEPGGKES